jgi:TfoX/Sxy family transcriptional regulator of competence genes
MATSVDYIEFVCEQIEGVGAVRYKKMFGENKDKGTVHLS